MRTFWEKQYPGPILWYGTTLEIIADYLEKLPIPKLRRAHAAFTHVSPSLVIFTPPV